MRATHEKIQPSSQTSFRCFDHRVPQFSFNWHFHPEYELTLIRRGHGKRYIGDSIEEYAENDLVLVGASLPHSWQSDPHQTGNQEAVVVQFLPHLFGMPDHPLAEFKTILKLLGSSSRGLHLDLDHELYHQIAALPKAAPLHRLNALYTILDRITETGTTRPLASENFKPSRAEKDKQRFDQVHNFLQAHLEESISMEEVARAHGMTVSTFGRFFKRNTGKTLIEYINNLRIGQACALLTDSDHTITEIAYQVGYANLSHFNRMFLRLRGMQPSEYRRLHG
jgi:AraC-like DNA-binding protein